MAIFKCKICGGTLELDNSQSVAICEYCGTKQTLPKLDDERRINLYDRANHFRRNNDFDKAMGIYENILNEDITDSEAYWSLVLCRYGIEYVEDPSTRKRVPTVNRAQFTSIFDDEDYKAAIEHSDGDQREIYEAEAEEINEIQKGILAISQKEEPFDIFICYKETDSNGRRTHDSVLATELYHELTREGFKVFFSRITLEDKLGIAYEPYIFAALNSAKVMVVLGTRPEHFNAVWVKNEWSRYLALIRNGAKKTLIPAYRDMDPYNLPEEFSHLQAQDMSKLGFMQDLIHGIKKIATANAPKEKNKVTSKEGAVIASQTSVTPLVKRIFLFLEEGDFSTAERYCEKVLDMDPENAQVYLAKLLIDLNIRNIDALFKQIEPFDNNINYQRALKYGDKSLADTLKQSSDKVENNVEEKKRELEEKRKWEVYSDALSYAAEKTEAAQYMAAEMFESISGYKDSAVLAEKCNAEAKAISQEFIYKTACNYMKQMNSVYALQAAIKHFSRIRNWKDSEDKISQCDNRLKELEILAKKQKKFAIIISVAILTAVFLIITVSVILRSASEKKAVEEKYQSAIELMEEELYTEAIKMFEELGNYKNANANNLKCKYALANELYESGSLSDAYNAFLELGTYQDSVRKATETYEALIKYRIKNAVVGDYIEFGRYEQDIKDAGAERIKWLVLARNNSNILVISSQILDCHRYNATDDDITWKDSSLREWLNDDFVNLAFSPTEQSVILPSTFNENGSIFTDSIFILSELEAKSHFNSTTTLKCSSTSYATSRVEYDSWWLRDTTSYYNGAKYVYRNGSIYSQPLSYGTIGVRPAMWIDTDLISD